MAWLTARRFASLESEVFGGEFLEHISDGFQRLTRLLGLAWLRGKVIIVSRARADPRGPAVHGDVKPGLIVSAEQQSCNQQPRSRQTATAARLAVCTVREPRQARTFASTWENPTPGAGSQNHAGQGAISYSPRRPLLTWRARQTALSVSARAALGCW